MGVIFSFACLCHVPPSTLQGWFAPTQLTDLPVACPFQWRSWQEQFRLQLGEWHQTTSPQFTAPEAYLLTRIESMSAFAQACELFALNSLSLHTALYCKGPKLRLHCHNVE